MAFYVVMGSLGSGKTSYAVSEALDYLKAGRRVVANFPLDFTGFTQPDPDSFVEVLPDVPTSDHLKALGVGGESEHKAGLLIIDEGIFCLNARDYADPDRKNIIQWFALSRKLKWDVILIIQHIQALDKQVRLLFAEHVVMCRRVDRLWFFQLLPFLPTPHLAVVRYGSEQHAPIARRKWFFPGVIGPAYDTAKLFDPESQAGHYCTLSRRLAVLRYLPPKLPGYVRACRASLLALGHAAKWSIISVVFPFALLKVLWSRHVQPVQVLAKSYI